MELSKNVSLIFEPNKIYVLLRVDETLNWTVNRNGTRCELVIGYLLVSSGSAAVAPSVVEIETSSRSL